MPCLSILNKLKRDMWGIKILLKIWNENITKNNEKYITMIKIYNNDKNK